MRVVQVVGAVETDDTRQQSPGAEAAGGERRALIQGLGLLCAGGRGDELLDRVLGVVLFGARREGGVLDEFAIVDAARVVEGQVVLGRVANG